jgi:adenylosuccinate synthase
LKKVSIVIGLGFGDEGKGITTDYLCSHAPEDTIVVRFSGGQQAGHTVMIGDKKHIHSNFGSGTLRGCPSYFSEHCTIYPVTIAREMDVLKQKGVTPKLFIHPLAKLTTPYDVAYNRVMEKINNHGSCGLGVGATMHRHLTTGYKIFVMDLQHPSVLDQKLHQIEKYYFNKLSNHQIEFSDIVAVEMDAFKSIKDQFQIENYEAIYKYNNIVFEGSQGILLDMDHGIFPHVTYAHTTSKNAVEICNKLNFPHPEMYYVTRCYQTRHGNGWMSNQHPIVLQNNHEEINTSNEWQGMFRVGELDYDLLNYALAVDENYTEPWWHKNLVVTCFDQRPGFNFEYYKLNTHFHRMISSHSPKSECFAGYIGNDPI